MLRVVHLIQRRERSPLFLRTPLLLYILSALVLVSLVPLPSQGHLLLRGLPLAVQDDLQLVQQKVGPVGWTQAGGDDPPQGKGTGAVYM